MVTLLVAFLSAFSIETALGQLTGQVPIAGKTIPKYVEPLPHFAGIRQPVGSGLTVEMLEFQQKVLPATFYTALAPPFNDGTYVWGYKVGSAPVWYPGFSVEAFRGNPANMTYVNSLPLSPVLQNYLWIDQTLHWADPLKVMNHTNPDPYTGPPPAVVHLHGGEVMSEYDGGPDQWFTPDGIKGLGYRTYAPTDPNAAIYHYENTQEPATLWFHDHTLGATRINVYAGLAAFYFLRDDPTSPTIERTDLPGGPADATVTETQYFLGGTANYAPEIEIAIQDRMFDANGQLYFPNLGINPEHPFWIPEFLGDVIVVNGKTWPFLNVEPRRYRFRFLNGSNARFYNMFLVDAVAGTPGPTIWQIGSDGGLMPAPAALASLLMGPGERADIIIDFSGFAGKTLLLRNNARSPYPKGVPADPQTTGQIMQFRVGTTITGNGGVDGSYNPATGGSPRLDVFPNITSASTVTRQLTLNEVMGPGGPLEVLVNNTKWNGKSPDGTPISAGALVDGAGNYVTELPMNGSTETWKIINLTADAHPIHLHLVQFQLVGRQNFNTNKYNKAYNAAFPGGLFIPAYGPPMDYFTAPGAVALGGNPNITPYLQGPLVGPGPNEVGWKDTFIMYPGQVTTVKVSYNQQNGAPFTFNPSSGPGYVWHCHIIDHEDNEMMRPQVVVPAAKAAVAANQQLEELQLNELKSMSPLPDAFALDQNYPNPFNPSTTITFQLPADAHVNLTVYNSVGQEVKNLIDTDAPAGWHSVQLDATGLASGVYYYRIQAGSFTDVKSMILMK